MFIVLGGSVFAVLIGLGMLCGAGLTEIIINFILNHQLIIIVVAMIFVLFNNMNIFEFSDNKLIMIILNTFIDVLISIGMIVVIFSYLYFLSSSFQNNFLGMMFLFVGGLAELLLVSYIAIGGGVYVPTQISEYLIENEVKLVIVKILYIILYLWLCVQLINLFNLTDSYTAMFSNSIMDFVMKLVSFLPLGSI